MNILLELTVDEVNAVLNALGQQPFKDVHQILDKIQRQAGVQFQSQEVPIPDSK